MPLIQEINARAVPRLLILPFIYFARRQLTCKRKENRYNEDI
jgi:hypothetical protein